MTRATPLARYTRSAHVRPRIDLGNLPRVPRLTRSSALTTAIDRFCAETISSAELLAVFDDARASHWAEMRQAGMSHVPCHDFPLHDQVLDMAVAVGAVPARYRAIADPVTRYMAMARGLRHTLTQVDLRGLADTTWSDTAHRHVIPELDVDHTFSLDADRILGEVRRARACDVDPRPVLLGPVTLLRLSRVATTGSTTTINPLDLLDRLLPVYLDLLQRLATEDVHWVQLDEPVMATSLSPHEQRACRTALQALTGATHRPYLLLASRAGDWGANLDMAIESGCEGLHVDIVNPEQLASVLDRLPRRMMLSLGVVRGDTAARPDLELAHAQLHRVVAALGRDRVCASSSAAALGFQPAGALEPDTGRDTPAQSHSTRRLLEIARLAAIAALPSPPVSMMGSHIETARRRPVATPEAETAPAVAETLRSDSQPATRRLARMGDALNILSFENRQRYPVAPLLFGAFIALQLTALYAFVRFFFRATWDQHVAAGPGAIVLTCLVCNVMLCFGEHFFHRYILHLETVRFLRQLCSSHRRHHKLTSIRFDATRTVCSHYPIEDAAHDDQATFPSWALLPFFAFFTPFFASTAFSFPWLPILIGGYAAIAIAHFLYEVIHLVHHQPYVWWQPRLEHRWFGGLWRRFYGFHQAHHANYKCNLNVAGFFGIPLADLVFGTYRQPDVLLVDGAAASKDVARRLTPEPRWPIGWLDRVSFKRRRWMVKEN